MAAFEHPDLQADGSMLCRFDFTRHIDVDDLHDYLKRFRVSREKYYTTYHPRKDKATGEPIAYKGDWKQYLTQDFTSKVTMKRWLSVNLDEGLKWSGRWLAARKEEKGLVYAPSQTELRTLQCPTMPYYNAVAENWGGYYGVTERIGFSPRYNGDPLVFSPLDTAAQVIQDTREQDPITLPLVTTKHALNVGDYALAAPHDQGVRIERKSLGDFCGTMSDRKVTRKGGRKGAGTTEDSALQRFARELQRAQDANLYVVMVVEANIADALRFDYLPQTQWIKARPSHVFHGLREMLTRYPLTFQCLFVDGRTEMARVIPRIFQLGQRVKTSDLQFHYEGGSL